MRGYSSRCIEKLKKLGAPLTGWECMFVKDIEEAGFKCELCEYDPIRYVHYMKHPDWADIIRVGCVCDGTMTGDMLSAVERDRKARNKAERKLRFMKKQWTQAADGTFILNTKSRITAETSSFRDKPFYIITVKGERYQWRDNRRMTDLSEAKMCAFEILEYEREQIQQNHTQREYRLC